MTAVLSIRDLQVSYGAVPAVRGVDLELHKGELRVILGANGAGKTTILKALLGLQKATSGSVQFDGRPILGMTPQQINKLGISWVPEGRQLWSNLSVYDNLLLGGFGVADKAVRRREIERMLERFPLLRQRSRQLAGSLSGGEQSLVAVARALISQPRVLLMDEPSLGLAPLMVKQIFDLVQEVNAAGVSILLVEQNARQALQVADWGYLLENGAIVTQGSAADLSQSSTVQDVFLGGSI
ncbi:ABC transporter ATP-binding protein [Devosia sp.]|uniref:ABC transporter ATP-binding protein n=1 Tax=Devosia sp. TaxID=1871048 RepID=UPI002EE1420A